MSGSIIQAGSSLPKLDVSLSGLLPLHDVDGRNHADFVPIGRRHGVDVADFDSPLVHEAGAALANGAYLELDLPEVDRFCLAVGSLQIDARPEGP